jgi:Carboxypeptidase regulatory-like domain
MMTLDRRTVVGAFQFLLSIAAVLGASVATIEACSCRSIDSPSACELYGRLPVAFVGRAIKVPEGAGGTVRFRILHALKGVQGREVSVLTADSRFGCGYPFGSGGEYVVFAGRNKNGDIEIGPCSGTVWRTDLDKSALTVAFAESLGKPATGGHIFGEVELAYPTMIDEGARKPVEGATVILRGGGKERRRSTSANGRYEFVGLPPGTYRVSVSMPEGLPAARSTRIPENLANAKVPELYERESSRSVTIAGARSCGYAPFLAASAVPLKRWLSGTVAWEDGRPLGLVYLRISEYRYGRLGDTRLARVHPPGAFGIELFEGRYVIKAEANDPRELNPLTNELFPPIGTAETTVTLGGDPKDVRLVLVPRRDRP